MRRTGLMVVAVAVALAGALAACGPQGGEEGAGAAGGPSIPGFPRQTASYVGEYQLTDGDGAVSTATFTVAGWRKLRFEMPHPEASRAAKGMKMVGVFDDANDRSLMYIIGPGATQTAMVMPQRDDFLADWTVWDDADGPPPRKVGGDRVAGLSCDVWEMAPVTADEPAQQACITSDGIFLRSGPAGGPPDMVATSVRKGPVDAALFAVPAGFEVIDMGPCTEAMDQAMAAAQAGKQPDLAAMQKCQAIAAKAAGMFGE